MVVGRIYAVSQAVVAVSTPSSVRETGSGGSLTRAGGDMIATVRFTPEIEHFPPSERIKIFERSENDESK